MVLETFLTSRAANIPFRNYSGTRYFAAPRSVIPVSCAVRLKAVKETKQHKKEIGCKTNAYAQDHFTDEIFLTVLGMVSTLLLLLQNRYKQRKAEDAQVKELVTISLAKLQDRASRLFEVDAKETS